MSDDTLSQANIQRFNDVAATWDDKPGRLAMARHVAAAMLQRLAPAGSGRMLEFGCGTGLITALLAPSFQKVVAMDSAPGMLAVLERKIEELPLENVETFEGDLSQTLPEGAFDAIVSSMTLHHVADVPGLLKRLYDHLSPGGQVALADLDAEDGSFHSDKPGIAHNGFERDDIRRWLEAAGFANIDFDTAYTMEKIGEDGVLRQFPIFLVSAQREQ